MQGLVKFITGTKSAWATLLLGLIFAALALGPLKATETSTNPGVGLPASADSVRVNEALKTLPGADSTSAVVVYQSKTAMTDAQQAWVAGKFNPVTKSFEGGASDKFLTFTNLKVMGKAFVPPASFSKDKTTAVIAIPLAKSDETKVIQDRIAAIRAAATAGVPTGLSAYTTGPDAFQSDLASVFNGANGLLLAATGSVVILLLLITYRSPSLWIVPLLVVGTADQMASSLAPRVAGWFGIVPDASVTGILSVLVFGAGTNYALLIIARYREELLTNQDRHVAMFNAVRGAGPAIIASGSTVTLALLTLSFATLEGNRALGIACATGIVIAMISALAVLPAALVVFGRGLFWPFAPKFGGADKSRTGFWSKLATGVSKRPSLVSVIGALVLVVLALGATGIKIGLAANDSFMKTPEAVVGSQALSKAFPAGQTSPTIVIANKDKAANVVDVINGTQGVASVSIAESSSKISQINVVLKDGSQSDAAYATIRELRTKVATVSGADAIVGGQDAQALEVKDAYSHDQSLVIPLILALVFLVLLLLLRSFVAPVLLLATVVASFFASMGAGWLLFVQVFGFPALDLSVFLYSFLFLVALGVDYNIFLVTRAKEEAEKLGLRAGMIRAVSATGGVITSAGILLAAVFLVLGVLPLVALAQIGAIVCIGVLLDTLLVRTVIVPALAFLTGKNFFWPAKIAE